MSPRRLFTLAATAEAITWTLLVIGMVLKYVTHTTELGVRVAGSLHGLVFLAYVLVTLLVATDQRWRPGQTVLGLASSVPPWATLWFERKAERERLLGGSWRLTHDAPANAAERLVRALLTRPWLALALGVVAVLVLFGVALLIGPPVPWARD